MIGADLQIKLTYLGVDFSSGVPELENNLCKPFLRCNVKRGDALACAGLNVCSLVQQQFHHCEGLSVGIGSTTTGFVIEGLNLTKAAWASARYTPSHAQRSPGWARQHPPPNYIKGEKGSALVVSRAVDAGEEKKEGSERIQV